MIAKKSTCLPTCKNVHNVSHHTTERKEERGKDWGKDRREKS